jgi:GNAT superfamily N-acetyltransferase
MTSPPDYRIRPATLADADTLVHHRIAMFTDMGLSIDQERLSGTFRAWLERLMPEGTYHAWVVEHETDGIVAGGGITIIPWPPGPRSFIDRLAFVYNVYTEMPHRSRGLGRLVMTEIHEWCRANGITLLGLNTSTLGKPLYDSLGYVLAPSPLMFFALE